MGKNKKQRKALMSQMRTYRGQQPPFDMSFDDVESPFMWWFSLEDSFSKDKDHICQLANKLFSIIPHAAGCERIWSTLGWYYGKRRTRLSLGKIENMQKLSSFYLSNLKNELPYFSVGKTVEKLHDILYDMDFYEENLEEEQIIEETHDIPIEETLRIEELLNLDAPDFTNNLGDIILDTNYDYGENEDNEELSMEVAIEDNDIEDEEWNPEKEADDILDEEY